MALGGYKFKGYRYSVPSDFNSSDDSQVKAQCLEMFRCRLKAFTESCLASGAEWEFSYTDGDYSFGSYGNVIYDLDNDGYNYGAFFKYRDKDWYMMLMNYQKGSSTSNVFYYIPNSNDTYYDASHNKSSCGLVEFSPDNYRSALSKRLRLRGTAYSSTSASLSPYIVNHFTGFATKGCDVVEVHKFDNSNATYNFKVMSPDGFASLCSPNDTAPLFDYVCNGWRSQNYNYASGNAYHINYNPIQTLKDTGDQITFSRSVVGSYGTENKGKMLSIFSQKESYYANPVSVIPYASPLITAFAYGFTSGGTVTDQSAVINQDGIRSKGYVKPELLSVNTPFPHTAMSGLNVLKPYAGGNYLLVEKFYISDSNGNPVETMAYFNGAVYCGWDPSNPDITQSTAWEDYVPEP